MLYLYIAESTSDSLESRYSSSSNPDSPDAELISSNASYNEGKHEVLDFVNDNPCSDAAMPSNPISRCADSSCPVISEPEITESKACSVECRRSEHKHPLQGQCIIKHGIYSKVCWGGKRRLNAVNNAVTLKYWKLQCPCPSKKDAFIFGTTVRGKDCFLTFDAAFQQFKWKPKPGTLPRCRKELRNDKRVFYGIHLKRGGKNNIYRFKMASKPRLYARFNVKTRNIIADSEADKWQIEFNP